MPTGKVIGLLHRILSALIPELKLELKLRLKLEPIKLKLDFIRYRLKGWPAASMGNAFIILRRSDRMIHPRMSSTFQMTE